MERSRRAVLVGAASVLTAGCTWTSRWRPGDRPETLGELAAEDELACEEWDDEPGNLTARIEAAPVVRPDREGGVTVTVRNVGVGDACYVEDVVRVSDNETVASIAVRVLPGRPRRIDVPVEGRGTARYRLGNGETTDEVLLVPEVARFGEPQRYGDVEVAVEDLRFRTEVEYERYGRTGTATISAPDGEIFGFVKVAATSLEDGACACLTDEVALVAGDHVYDPVPDAGVLDGVDRRIRLGALAEPFAGRFQNRTVADGETVRGWLAFQVPATAAEKDPLVRLGGVTGRYWAVG